MPKAIPKPPAIADICFGGTPLSFDIDGLHIEALSWGEPSAKPLIALHGWLDNAAGYHRLAPLLKDHYVVAIDLPGHGYSDHKPAHATYNLWDDLLVILAVADELGWEQFDLIAHSRGAMIATILAASSPERISALVCLDGMLPPPTEASEAPAQLGKHLREYRGVKAKRLPVYESFDEAVTARCRSANMSEEASRPIVARALRGLNAEELERKPEGQYTWRSDARLRLASAFKMSREHCEAMVDALSMPVLLLLADQGYGGYSEIMKLLEPRSHIQRQLLKGSHHWHLEEAAEEIAAAIRGFLS